MKFLEFVENKDFQAKFNFIRDIVLVIGVIATIITVHDLEVQTHSTAEQTQLIAQQTKYSAQQTKESKYAFSAQIVDTIYQRLDSSNYSTIKNAVEGDDNTVHNTAKIWDQEGGKFTTDQIDNYISNFDEIGNLYDDNLIDKNMAYDEFSYDAEKAWCNNSIRDYVENARQGDGSYKYHDHRADYWGFQQLATISLQIDKQSCTDLNKE